MNPFDRRSDGEDPRRPSHAEGHGLLTSLLLVSVGMLLAVGVYLAVDFFRTRNAAPPTNPDAQPREATPAGPLDPDEAESVAVFRKLKPSVVNVDIMQRQRVGWGNRVAERKTGAGSGFVWDDDGRIVTNYHVIADSYQNPDLVVRVTLADRTSWDTVIVGKAEEYDLAVLQFAPHSRPPADKIRKIELGTSHDLQVGQKAYAIGNPLGLSLTMTRGIISALDRPLTSPVNTTIPGGIQTDAAINPGNSGGPLLDKSGRLIGVTSSIAVTQENSGNIGIGFAIPSDLVNQVVTEIIRHGRVLRPSLGIRLFDQQKLRRARYDRGVMIERTTPDGPADRAGLRGIRVDPRTRDVQPGDLIVAINGEPVNSPDDYENAVRKLKPGDTATVRIFRDETEQDVKLQVGGA
jgi:S1-C subfamily serine protease